MNCNIHTLSLWANNNWNQKLFDDFRNVNGKSKELSDSSCYRSNILEVYQLLSDYNRISFCNFLKKQLDDFDKCNSTQITCTQAQVSQPPEHVVTEPVKAKPVRAKPKKKMVKCDRCLKEVREDKVEIFSDGSRACINKDFSTDKDCIGAFNQTSISQLESEVKGLVEDYNKSEEEYYYNSQRSFGLTRMAAASSGPDLLKINFHSVQTPEYEALLEDMRKKVISKSFNNSKVNTEGTEDEYFAELAGWPQVKEQADVDSMVDSLRKRAKSKRVIYDTLMAHESSGASDYN